MKETPENPIERAASILARLVKKKRKPLAEAEKELNFSESKKKDAEKNFDRNREEVLKTLRNKKKKQA